MIEHSAGLAKPPEGVIAGESVPRENGLSDKEKEIVWRFVGKMKSKGKPFVDMKDSELRKKAEEKLVERGVIR